MPPVLQTDRLRLRPPCEEDLQNIYRLGASKRVMQYITPGRTQNLEEARADLKKRMSLANQPFGYWITEIKQTGEFIGWMALKQLDDRDVTELGYRFLEDYWGRGYATEAGHKVLSYGFRTLDLDRVAAVAVEENLASTRVMEKLGMRFIQHGEFYGTRCVYYEIKRREFIQSEW